MPEINPARLMADLRTLATFGAYKTGVHRPTFSPQDMEARRWMVGRLQDAGLEGSIDGIGNVYGMSRAPGRKVLAGSHLESQNYAGWLDGAMGVVYALEAARAIGEDKALADVGVDVAAFCDEEGHFPSFIGSRSYVGDLAEAEIDTITNPVTGAGLRAALIEVGLAGLPRLEIEPGRHAAFFEAHIEQGDVLEQAGLRIGVVTAVVAIWQYRITVTGEQNHAGTTSMARRRDAGRDLVRLLAAIDAEFPKVAGPRSVWTTGKISLDPGAKSIIPGRAEALFQLRDADPAVLERMEAKLKELVAEVDAENRCDFVLERLSASRPAPMDEHLQGLLDAAAERRVPGGHIRMPSGAGHDAQWLARKLPSAMLFVPSIGGISHHWSEDTSEADLILGAQVFTDAIAAALAG
jgi:N-carbamoyl-L-amino-acid hydrolase